MVSRDSAVPEENETFSSHKPTYQPTMKLTMTRRQIFQIALASLVAVVAMDYERLLPHRWSRDTRGHGNRFDRYTRGIVNTVVDDWQFANRPGNLAGVCERAFVELEKVIQQELQPNTLTTHESASSNDPNR
jgi:hypothetical protein